MSIPKLSQQRPAWLATPSRDQKPSVILASRIRLARNLAATPLRSQLDTDQQKALVSELTSLIPTSLGWPDAYRFESHNAPPLHHQALRERRHCSRDLGADGSPGGVVIAADEATAVMCNEEDHVRIQCIAPGMALRECLTAAITADQRLENDLTWATHRHLGYLTSCPTNVGTGMRASVMLHLPGLVETREISKAVQGIAHLHLTARGFNGEGSANTGHFYQISNQQTLGLSEDMIIDQVEEAIESILHHEHLAREALMRDRRTRIEDRAWRAWGLLTTARSLTSDEMVDNIAWLRLGRSLDLIPTSQAAPMDHLLVTAQPGHLGLLAGDEPLDPEARDALRATLIRKHLGEAA